MITTIRRATIFDALCAAVDEARHKAAGNDAWQNAIVAAWEWLLEEEAYEVVDVDTEHAAVRVPSRSKAGLIYTANGACQCRAYELHNPCMHRAASRLVRNALAKANKPVPVYRTVRRAPQPTPVTFARPPILDAQAEMDALYEAR